MRSGAGVALGQRVARPKIVPDPRRTRCSLSALQNRSDLVHELWRVRQAGTGDHRVAEGFHAGLASLLRRSSARHNNPGPRPSRTTARMSQRRL